MNAHHRLTKLAATSVVAVAAACFLAACGGQNKPPAAGSAASTRNSQSSEIKSAYRFSACMRSHGVTNFQDPKVSTKGNGVQVAIHVDPAMTTSPSFKSAQRACGHILPGPGMGAGPAQQRAREQAMLAFANCMRRHGFPRFPDPTSQGRLTLVMIRQAGIDLQQPAVKPAAYACAPVTHGLLNRANINQALANPTVSGTQNSSGGGS